MGCWSFGKSTRSQTFLSCKNFILSFVALYHNFCCSQGSFAISWYCFGMVHSPWLTARAKWCCIHLLLYVSPRSSSSLVGLYAISAGIISMEDSSWGEGSSWIQSSPRSISLLICAGGWLPYALSGKNWDCGIWVDLYCTTGGLKDDLSSQVGWCWWGQDLNSDSDSPDCCLGGNQFWGIGFTNQSSSSKEREAGGESVSIYLLCWCPSSISLLCPVSGQSCWMPGWRGEKSVLYDEGCVENVI